jgi:tRNA U54 and U55 pseudouridine synthase Pus10
MTLSTDQLDELIEKYCNRVVDEMDTKSMEQMLYDLLLDSFSQSNENDMEELISAIYGEEYYRELVEEVTAD